MDATLLPTLKAAILAETDPAFVALRQANETGQMAAFYNADASPAFTVWRSTTQVADVFNAITWKNFTPADTPDGTALYTNRAYHALLCQQNIMILLQGASSVSTGRLNVRASWTTCARSRSTRSKPHSSAATCWPRTCPWWRCGRPCSTSASR